MQHWSKGEPSLDELLCDDMMDRVVASTGMSREEFRSRLAEIANRLDARAAQSGADGRGNEPRAAVRR